MAVKSFIATDTKGFPPVPGIIKDHILKVTRPPQKSELEAWGEVKRALSRSGYDAEEEFQALDDDIKRVVGSPSTLREWARYDIERLDSVIGSNFQRSYKAVSSNSRDRAALPSAISGLVKQLAENMDMKPKPELENPKPLPVSVDDSIEAVKEEIRSIISFQAAEIPKKLTDEEFEKKRAEILRELGV